GLKKLRIALARVREDKQVRMEIVDTVVGVSRDVDQELNLLQDKLTLARQRTAEFQAEAAELRTDMPSWINSAAIVSSVVLLWMALGQLSQLCLGWRWLRRSGTK